MPVDVYVPVVLRRLFPTSFFTALAPNDIARILLLLQIEIPNAKPVDHVVEVLMLLKFDMHLYTSSMDEIHVNWYIKAYNIPVDLHPRVAPTGMIMDQLPDDAIGLYLHQFQQGSAILGSRAMMHAVEDPLVVAQPTAEIQPADPALLPPHQAQAYDTLSRYKACLVVNGSTQLSFIDVDETFSPVVKLATIRTVLSLVVSQHWVDGDPVSDLTLYRSLARALQHLTFTRPDISYVVQHVCLYIHDPREPHFSALKLILCYVWGTLDYGLQ
ncbi:ribonuclease H-like domain-containing protein [Tanacetum coccineum]